MVIILLFIAVLSTLCKGGRPPALHEENHPNWIPTVNMGYATDVADDARYSRLQQRRRKQSERESEERQTENSDCPSSSVDTGTVGEMEAHEDVIEAVETLTTHQKTDDQLQVSMLEKKELKELRKENTILRKEVEVLSKFYNQQNQSLEDKLKDDEKLLKFYTGKQSICITMMFSIYWLHLQDFQSGIFLWHFLI